ncbi:MAG: leucyl aminopeptidase family protein [Mangrovicoccus sp.]|nr:leucyl aminopeptidase family protein [Mangrovicoccus sp.]
MMPVFAPVTEAALPLFLLQSENYEAWLQDQPEPWRAWLASTGFKAASGQLCLLPGADGNLAGAAFGLGGASAQARGRFLAAQARAALPAGTWRITTELAPQAASEAALGWLLAGYQFDRYKSASPNEVLLCAPDGVDAARIERIAAAEFRIRDLINTPASDMGPAELEDAVRHMGEGYGARCSVISGAELAEGFPLIHTVGRASPRAPRLIDLRWGSQGPRLTLVGKGVCFDTGGLNLKPGGSMGLMKKDMGGAANAAGLAQMIMSQGLPVQLRLLVPAVENAVGGAAFRPQDVLTSRAGLTVEVNNTDAEGRLVLADALALAGEETPDLLISLATLTGAARVAVGPDIAPFFTDDEGFASALSAAAQAVRDPVWRLPFHPAYENMIEPGIADLDNAPSGGFAGAITAALFLRRFAGQAQRYAHFDIYGWQPSAAPARPKGGVGQGVRAIFEALPRMLDLPG